MKQSGMQGFLLGSPARKLRINALLPAAVCIGLFEVSPKRVTVHSCRTRRLAPLAT